MIDPDRHAANSEELGQTEEMDKQETHEVQIKAMPSSEQQEEYAPAHAGGQLSGKDKEDTGFLVDNRLDLIHLVCPSDKGG